MRMRMRRDAVDGGSDGPAS